MGVSFLHAADLHLGLRITRFDDVACKRIGEARFEAIENLRAKAAENRVDFILIAGDVFDDHSVSWTIAERAFTLFEGKAMSCPVFIIPGNHDPLASGGVWDRDPWSRQQPAKHTQVLREQVPFGVPNFPVTLFPCPLRHRNSIDDPTGWIAQHPRGPDDRTFRIGLAHGSLNIMPNLPEDDHLIRKDAADYYGLDYLALGHWHKPLRYKSADGAERTAYSGTHEPMRFPGAGSGLSAGWTSFSADGDAERFQDNGHGTVQLVRIDEPGAAPQIETIEVGRLRWSAEERDLTAQRLGEIISEYADRHDRALTVLQLRLSGVLDPEQYGRIDSAFRDIVCNRYCPGSSLNADDVLVEPDPEQLRKIVGDGVLARVLGRLQLDAQTADAAGKHVASHALKLLYRIAWGGAATMILESFEIENWSCIKRVAVADLPATGLIVLHGPNGTGKTSILEALRACLMDNKSTSKALARGFPKNSNDKPRVSVVFHAAGTCWRITKQFASKESKLESRTATGQWKLETADASAAHERTRELTGGSDSTLGLHQLLWLTQAEFHLPEPKNFDADVQSRLRTVLGVLQTPLDDCFLGRVKEAWARWFGARSKPGEKPKLKKDCPLDKALAVLVKNKAELATIETEFQSYERLIDRSSDLEILLRDLRTQLNTSTIACDSLQKEYERSLTRLQAHQSAMADVATAEEKHIGALATRQKRAEAEERFRIQNQASIAAGAEVEEKRGQLNAAEQNLRELRGTLQGLANKGRELQQRRDAVLGRLKRLALKEKLNTAEITMQKAENASAEHERLKEQERKRPAPDGATLTKFETNRGRAAQLRADLEAAAITLTLTPDAGAQAPRLTIDGTPLLENLPRTTENPMEHSVRRRAEVFIPGWGHIALTRGSDARDLDQIEADINECDRQFGDALAPFGIAPNDSAPLDLLRGLAAEKKSRIPEMKRIRDELAQLAPQGLEPLRQEVGRLENLVRASDAACQSETNDLPLTANELERLAEGLKDEIDGNQHDIQIGEEQCEEIQKSIDGVPNTHGRKENDSQGVRQQEATARDRLIAFQATAASLHSELERMLTADQIEREIRDAEEALTHARGELEAAKLNESEQTIGDRLEAAKESVKAIRTQANEAEREFSKNKGILSHTEGLHQKRAAAASRVEELTRQTERETLESEAFDRLYALFEECREKQLSTVMGPIHDRVLRWMKLLRIAGYESIRFNDQFLPESLLTRDGTAEMALSEESTGTFEQLALMVRLALGSALSKPEEPVVAMLDDPLTHSDVVRLDRMRAVLKSAAAGALPNAGAIQIFVFTCHPEWFAIDGAKVVDLGKPDILSRNAF